jgi:hypothetical protein
MKMRQKGRETGLELKWEGELMVLCFGTKHWEELKGAQVLEMEEYIGSHKRGVAQGLSVEQNMMMMAKVGVCSCHEISTTTVTRMDSLKRKVYGAVWSRVKWGQKPARTQGFVCSEVKQKE